MKILAVSNWLLAPNKEHDVSAMSSSAATPNYVFYGGSGGGIDIGWVGSKFGMPNVANEANVENIAVVTRSVL